MSSGNFPPLPLRTVFTIDTRVRRPCMVILRFHEHLVLWDRDCGSRRRSALILRCCSCCSWWLLLMLVEVLFLCFYSFISPPCVSLPAYPTVSYSTAVYCCMYCSRLVYKTFYERFLLLFSPAPESPLSFFSLAYICCCFFVTSTFGFVLLHVCSSLLFFFLGVVASSVSRGLLLGYGRGT